MYQESFTLQNTFWHVRTDSGLVCILSVKILPQQSPEVSSRTLPKLCWTCRICGVNAASQQYAATTNVNELLVQVLKNALLLLLLSTFVKRTFAMQQMRSTIWHDMTHNVCRVTRYKISRNVYETITMTTHLNTICWLITCIIIIIYHYNCKKLSSLQCFLRTTSAISQV